MLKKTKYAGLLVAAAMAVTALPAAGTATAAPMAPLPKIAAPANAELPDVVEVGHKRKYRKLKRKYKKHHKRHYKRYHKHRHFDAGSFIAGTLLGVIITHPRPHYVYDYRYLPRVHVHYCTKRYKSYRLWDNSWQPYHGPRRLCRSPYVR